MRVITKTEIVQKEQKTYKYYCDECGVIIGEGLEYDSYGDYIRTYDDYEIRKTLCHKCAEIKDNQIITVLANIGFKRR